MTTWLVIGALGALGRKVVAGLRNSGYQVKEADILITEKEASSEKISMDVTRRESVESVINRLRPTHIAHLAGCFSPDFDLAYTVNVQSSRYILESIEKFGLKTRVILIGSAAEYGLVHPDENPIKTTHVLTPVSVYGMTKAWQTQLSGIYSARGLDVLLARVFNIYGPGIAEVLFAGRVRRQAEEIIAGKRDKIIVGDLSAIRDYISTEEAARQIILLAERGKSGSIYHVASGVPVSMSNLLDKILLEYGIDKSCVEASPGNTNRKGLDVPVIFADMTSSNALYGTSLS